MSKPIPDEVLREMTENRTIVISPDGSGRSMLNVPMDPQAADLARELLALREAARRVAGEYDIAELIDAILEMRDLLPKEAP